MEAKNVLNLALCLARLNGSIACVKLLVEARADVNCILSIHCEVKSWCSQDHLIAEMLPSEHPDLEPGVQQQLYASFLNGTSLLTGAETKTRPLLIASSLGFTGLVVELLESAADTACIVAETQGMTALSIASLYGHQVQPFFCNPLSVKR